MNLIDKIIAEAEKWVGYLEKRSNAYLDEFTKNAGSKNYTRFNRDYKAAMKSGTINMQWCGAFVSCVFMYVLGFAKAKEVLGGNLHSYTPSGVANFKRKGRYVKRGQKKPERGWVVFFYSKAKGRVGHVGIVYKVTSSYVYTIEGNTSGGGGLVTNGGSVRKKSYRLTSTYIDGYGIPLYDGVVVQKLRLGDRTLRKGMEGDDVVELQTLLKKWGYSLGKYGIDGEFGSATQAAVKAFQKDNKLAVDGIAGKNTFAMIKKKTSA